MQAAHDRSGNSVTVGARVRVLTLSGPWLDHLSPSERTDVLSIVGEVHHIQEIDEYGQAWILREWRRSDGTIDSHSVGLSSDEMELAPV